MTDYDFQSSGAFVKQLDIAATAEGPLSGLTFAVKDLIDIGREITGCGNPSWAASHPPAATHAVCVEQVLQAGANCRGKTVTDELAFSLIGENHFYGTPVNPRAPERVPGGSSSGSASAVACGLVDFALGTDTGGSVRVPSSNCGIWGFRPSHGRISVAGVNPFAPTLDTVGILARDGKILRDAAHSLFGQPETSDPQAHPTFFVATDMLEACDPDVQAAISPVLDKAAQMLNIRETSLHEITGQAIDYMWLFETYSLIQCSEIWSCLGAWIVDEKPEFGPVTSNNFKQAENTLRSNIQAYQIRRTALTESVQRFLEPGHFLLQPTTPALAPLLQTIGVETQDRASSTYFPRALGMNAIAGLSGACQVSMPVGNAAGVPVGLSMIGRSGSDMVLIEQARSFADALVL